MLKVLVRADDRHVHENGPVCSSLVGTSFPGGRKGDLRHLRSLEGFVEGIHLALQALASGAQSVGVEAVQLREDLLLEKLSRQLQPTHVNSLPMLIKPFFYMRRSHTVALF